MRTRSQSNRHPNTASGEAGEDAAGGSERRKAPAAARRKSAGKVEPLLAKKSKSKAKTKLCRDASLKQCTAESGEQGKVEEEEVGTSGHDDATEMDWEEGHVSTLEHEERHFPELGKTVTVEFTDSLPSAEKKSSRRATAEEKELAELVHKVHLLCLLARGRIIDKACNDPLIQASILSLLPTHLLKIADTPKLTANKLEPLVNWFHRTFRVTPEGIDRGSFESNLAFALQSHEGTAEEVGALSVALFRALNLTARFVAILDVAALKPDAKVVGTQNRDASRLDTKALPFTTTTASNNEINILSPGHLQVGTEEGGIHGTLRRGNHGKGKSTPSCKKILFGSLLRCQSDNGDCCVSAAAAAASKSCDDQLPSTSKNVEGPKRKGDLEFELQMEMALSATVAGLQVTKPHSQMDELIVSLPSFTPPLKKLRQTKTGETSSTCGNSSAIWSRIGAAACWAEVYCSGETLTGRWVHVDAADGIVDGEDKVEAASAVCRKPLKYVVAFAGNGAKDVTRRYCLQWYKILPRRINPEWWDKVLAPLKQLELAATGGMVEFETTQEKAPLKPNLEENKANVQSSLVNNSTEHINTSTQGGAADGSNAESCSHSIQLEAIKPASQFHDYRHCLEDMELETRALTEPFPTNQQAYRSHHLYALEKWLNKNQVLHPKGPVLGYCSGHPVYPRSCVQTLLSRHRWLREGLQVRANEFPAKIVKRTKKMVNVQSLEFSGYEDGIEPTMELYGKWQLEPLQLPHAVNGIVPKSERGQVEVWSEKCLPPGTTHLRLPRLVPVARRLDIDFAPAMVGFEFRNGRSLPLFDGIVVCTEFKDAILEAYAEEEERREAEERKRDEAQALSRWYQLLSSIVTRQRLKNSYTSSRPTLAPEPLNDENNHQNSHRKRDAEGEVRQTEPSNPYSLSPHEHEHVFPSEDQSFDEEMLVRTKRCPCGFSIQVEEL